MQMCQMLAYRPIDLLSVEVMTDDDSHHAADNEERNVGFDGGHDDRHRNVDNIRFDVYMMTVTNRASAGRGPGLPALIYMPPVHEFV